MMPSYGLQSDAELLRRVSTDGDAFDEFYRRYEPIVLAFLRRRSGSADVAADLAADTFVEVLGSAGRFRDRDGGPAAGWLLAIANHVWLRHIRRADVSKRTFERLGLERPAHASDDLRRVDELLDVHAGRNPLIEALRELPQEQQTAIRAFVLDERPYSEISAVLGVREGTLRQRVRRGLSKLKTSIQEAAA